MAKHIPLYDETAPITCTAGASEIADRIALIERMHGLSSRVDRGEHGLLLHFPNEPGVEADVRRFTVDEKACCAFWGFAVDVAGNEVLLRWDAPPALDDYVDKLQAYFEGDEPLSAVSGLL